MPSPSYGEPQEGERGLMSGLMGAIGGGNSQQQQQQGTYSLLLWV